MITAHGCGGWVSAIRRGSARGSGTMLNVAVMMMLLSLAAAVAVVARYGLAVHQAQNVADLSALAGAQANAGGVEGASGCAAARRTAALNSGRLISCGVVGSSVDFVVTVHAEVDVVEPVLGMPRTVTREAHAGPVR